MDQMIFGIDVGNYNTKSQNTTMASGYEEYLSKPLLAERILEYEGKYYVPNIDNRIPYKIDKTENDQYLVLTLMSIAEEILFVLKRDGKIQDAQAEISKIKSIKLGVGLPPGHFNHYAKKTSDYYLDRMKSGISFRYAEYDFSFRLDKVRVMPQDVIAVYKNKQLEIPFKYDKYYIIGIGGGTVDLIPIIQKKPDVNNCYSLEEGTRIMYNHAIGEVQRHTGEMLTESDIESVLLGRPNVLPEDVVKIIKKAARDHTAKILDKCKQHGARLKMAPAVFFGGGCLLFKEYLEEKRGGALSEFEILEDVNANAKNYAACMALER